MRAEENYRYRRGGGGSRTLNRINCITIFRNTSCNSVGGNMIFRNNTPYYSTGGRGAGCGGGEYRNITPYFSTGGRGAGCGDGEYLRNPVGGVPFQSLQFRRCEQVRFVEQQPERGRAVAACQDAVMQFRKQETGSI